MLTAASPWVARRAAWALLVLSLGASCFIGLSAGPTSVMGVWGGLDAGTARTILWDMRLPRVLLGVCVGAALGASGATFQGLFRNPLAEPYLLGAASGAALGSTIGMVVLGAGGGLGAPSGWTGPDQLVPLFAYVGAIAAVLTALVLAGTMAGTNALVLGGVVVGQILAGLTTVIILLNPTRLPAIFAVTLGSLSLAGWREVRVVTAYLAPALAVLLAAGRPLNALQLGDDVATTLGLPVRGLRLVLVGAATLATAAAVSHAGIIGFVGLVVPHTVRRWLGDDYAALLPGSALGGAALLVAADALARSLVAPAELPMGIITTLLGGPFFLYLLRRHREHV